MPNNVEKFVKPPLPAYFRILQSKEDVQTGQNVLDVVSHTHIEVTLKTDSGDTLKLPAEVSTKVIEVKKFLGVILGHIDPFSLVFVVKRGCSYRQLQSHEQIARNITVKGIKDFKTKHMTYPHPFGIIGAGYNGIKTAMTLERRGDTDYIVFDRYDQVGGHAWLEAANKTTRLQTEFGTYHVWYGPETSDVGIQACGGAPLDWEIWPTADRVVEHMQLAAKEYGILPRVRLNTNVEEMTVVGKVNSMDHHFMLRCQPQRRQTKKTQGGGCLPHQVTHSNEYGHEKLGEPYDVAVSCMIMYPGNLVYPRMLRYRNEEAFEGQIEYAIERRFNYETLKGKVVVIHGHGAFTMENIRTCLEAGMKKIFLLCRKINMTCPRVVSWLINQAEPPLTGPHVIELCKGPYKHLNIDPWNLHSVTANASHTKAAINQKTRFGVGDVYYLAAAYGLMEVVVGEVDYCSSHSLHLTSGKTLECDVVLKCLGFLGDWNVDRLMHLNEMVGFWPNADPYRFVASDADGVHANNFAGTTIGPGAHSYIHMGLHFIDTPEDWKCLEENGTIRDLPKHYPFSPTEETPGYMVDARHATTSTIMTSSSSLIISAQTHYFSNYKNYIQLLCHSPERFLREAKADWEHYEKHFREKGMVPQDAPYVPYLYTEKEIAQAFDDAQSKYSLTA